MEPELLVIETIEDIQALKKYLAPFEYVAYDCETTGVDLSSEVMGFGLCTEDAKAYYVILHKWNPETKRIDYASPEKMAEAKILISCLMDKKLVEHNGLFDSAIAENYFKVPLIKALHTCTMILAQLLDENRRVGLKELAKEMFGLSATAEQEEMKASVIKNGGRWTQEHKDMYMADPYVLGKYGAKDPWLTLQLFYRLIPQLEKEGLYEFFYEEESMPLLKGPTYTLNRTGIVIDQGKLQKLKKTLEAECEEAKAFIFKEIQDKIKDKPKFNIAASQQISWLLFGQYGLKFKNLTDGGREACRLMGMRLPYTDVAKRQFISECLRRAGEKLTPDSIINGKKKTGKKIKQPWAYIAADADVLEELASKYKWIQALIDYNRKKKLLSTYIGGVESSIRYGVVTSSYLQHGTMTGRYASRNPNLMNLPREDQRIKECYVSRPGKIFVSADYSQLEPRVFSFYSRDPKLMSSFTGESDFYSVVGQDVHDITDCEPTKDSFGKKYKDLRQDSKTIALAAAYGATPNQLAPVMGKSVDDTAEIMERYFERFPGVRKMMLEAHDLAKSQGYVENLFKRRRRLPDALKVQKMYGKVTHWKLPYEARSVLNQACNFRVQSTAASLINRAAIALYNRCKELDIDAKIVSQIHDELVIECLESQAGLVSELLRDAMENTNKLPGVPLEAIPRITRTLAK